MLFQVLGDGLRIREVPVHAHAQRLDALNEQERVERADARPDIAQPLNAARMINARFPKTSKKFIP